MKFQSCQGLGKTTCQLQEILEEIVDLKKYQNQWFNEMDGDCSVIYRNKRIEQKVRKIAHRLQQEWNIPFVVYDGLDEPYWYLCDAPEFVPSFPSPVYVALTEQPTKEETVRCILVPTNYFYTWVHVNEDAIETVLLHEVGHHETWEDLTEDDRKDARLRQWIGHFLLHEFFRDDHEDYKTVEAYYLYMDHHFKPELIADYVMDIGIADMEFAIYNQYDFVPNLGKIFTTKGLENLLTADIGVDSTKASVQDAIKPIHKFIVEKILTGCDNPIKEERKALYEALIEYCNVCFEGGRNVYKAD